ncbi:hypothetical protein HYZ99_03940 [Candidatus Peregrinibacteria bacterium]|nr:hypothetical protein [Candidatus Peregrinibacteria bacterium]
MSISLKRLERKKLNLGMDKLGSAGIDVERWLAMVDADEQTMKELVAAWPKLLPSFTYDAVALFGFGEPSKDPLPKPRPGEIVIRVGDWSLADLLNCPLIVRKNLFWQQDWYHGYPWVGEKMRAGIYRVRMPIPDSNRKTAPEQEKLFLHGEDFVSVCLGATTLAAHLHETGQDLLNGDWTRCKERSSGGVRAGLVVHEGRVYLGGRWDGLHHGYVWASSAREASES